MGIFTSQKKSLHDLPKPSSLNFDTITGSNIESFGEEKQEIVTLPNKSIVKKQMFVKMDNYREAINTIEKIKDKIGDANRLISELQRMKAQEDDCLAKWHQDMDNIRNKLNKMDEILYDVEK